MMEDTKLEVELDVVEVFNEKYMELELEEEEETMSSTEEEDINLDRCTWYVPQDVAFVILSFLEVREIVASQRVSTAFLTSGRSDYLWGTVIGKNISRYEIPFKEYEDFHNLDYKLYDTMLPPFRRLYIREKQVVEEIEEEWTRQCGFRKERGEKEFKRRYISIMIGFFGSIASSVCECVRCPFEILALSSLCLFCCIFILCTPFSVLCIFCLLFCSIPLIVFVCLYLCSVRLFFRRSRNLGRFHGEVFYDANVDHAYRNWLRFMYSISQAVDKICCCCFLHCGVNWICQLGCILYHGASLNICCFACCWGCYCPLFAFLNICCCPIMSLISVMCTWSGFLVTRVLRFLMTCCGADVREDIEIYICFSPCFWMEMTVRWSVIAIGALYCDNVYDDAEENARTAPTFMPIPTSYPEEFKRWWNDKMKKIFG